MRTSLTAPASSSHHWVPHGETPGSGPSDSWYFPVQAAPQLFTHSAHNRLSLQGIPDNKGAWGLLAAGSVLGNEATSCQLAATLLCTTCSPGRCKGTGLLEFWR